MQPAAACMQAGTCRSMRQGRQSSSDVMYDRTSPAARWWAGSTRRRPAFGRRTCSAPRAQSWRSACTWPQSARSASTPSSGTSTRWAHTPPVTTSTMCPGPGGPAVAVHRLSWSPNSTGPHSHVSSSPQVHCQPAAYVVSRSEDMSFPWQGHRRRQRSAEDPVVIAGNGLFWPDLYGSTKVCAWVPPCCPIAA